jgi:hypothetical protein
MQSVYIIINNKNCSKNKWSFFNFIEIHIDLEKKSYPTHYKKEGKLAAW